MAIGTRYYARPYLAGGGLPRGVKGLIIANSVVFLLMWLVGVDGTGPGFLEDFSL